MARVPAATRESVPENQRDAYDQVIGERGGSHPAGGPLLDGSPVIDQVVGLQSGAHGYPTPLSGETDGVRFDAAARHADGRVRQLVGLVIKPALQLSVHLRRVDFEVFALKIEFPVFGGPQAQDHLQRLPAPVADLVHVAVFNAV